MSLFVRVHLRLTHLQRELLISPPRSFIIASHLQLATRGMRVVFVTRADETGGLMETTEKIRLSQSGQSNVLLNAYFPDIDECHDGSHMCRYTQVCQNTVGGYGCVCPRGYRSQGVGLPCLGKSSRNIRSAPQPLFRKQTPATQLPEPFWLSPLTLRKNLL